MAGIDVYKPLKNKNGVDYSTEIPFQKDVPIGRFEAESKETPEIDLFKSNISLQQIEQKRRDEDEKRMRDLDAKRMKKLKEKNLPKALQAINKVNLQSEELVRLQLNTSLILNDPKISEQELYDI